MKTEVIIYNVVNLLIIIFNVVAYIKSIKLRKKNKEILDGLRTEADENDRLTNLINDINEGIRIHNDRLDLLSRENSKLITKNNLLSEENDELKDRLRDLGIKDFDVIN